MTSIKLTSDGYSFHTMELKIHPGKQDYDRTLKMLYQAAKDSKNHECRTYPLSQYQALNDSHCSTVLSPHGVLLYLTRTKKRSLNKYTIKAVINPRRVLDPECGYLGIIPPDEASLETFQDEFTLIMRKYGLPEFLDNWTLTRLDLCVNLQFNKKKSAREICRLLQKDLLPSKMKRVLFWGQNGGQVERCLQAERNAHSVCLENDSYALVVYDKLYQIQSEKLYGRTEWTGLPDGILRVELRCYKPYLEKHMDKKQFPLASDQIGYLVKNSRRLLLGRVRKTFSGGAHYKPDVAREIIRSSPFQKHTREQLWSLFDRMRRPFDMCQLERWMKKRFGLNPRTVAKRLEQLQELDINRVPLRKDFYLEKLLSLPQIIKRLEDDSVTMRLRADGSVS